MAERAPQELDALIIGGGAAGLWVLNSLTRAGYDCRLFSDGPLGAGQSIASQGIIHSGLKYGAGSPRQALRDGLGNMPERWRAAMAAAPNRPPHDPDLSSLETISPAFHLFSSDQLLDQLRAYFAGHLLAAKTETLAPDAWPAGLRSLAFTGQVQRLEEFTIDPQALIDCLQQPVRARIQAHRLDASRCTLTEAGVAVAGPQGGLRARRLILCAGAGNATLIDALNLPDMGAVRRPLHQVIVKHPQLPMVQGHCLTGVRGTEPRFTVTSHRNATGGWDWYLGGQLATKGCDRTAEAQSAFARAELAACLPHFDWQQAVISTLAIDRAEPDEPTQRRTGTTGRACVAQGGAALACWPIKLTLLPDLADQVLAILPPPARQSPTAAPYPAVTRNEEHSDAQPQPPGIAALPWRESLGAGAARSDALANTRGQPRRLNNTSALGLGTVGFGRSTGLKYPEPIVRPTDEALAALLARARTLGVNLLDTATAYGDSAARIGRLIGPDPYWFVVTKVGERHRDAHSCYDFSPTALRQDLAQAHRDLQRPVLDAVLLHSNGHDERALMSGDAFGTLIDSKAAQQVRYIGASLKTSEGIEAAWDSPADLLMLTLNPSEPALAPWIKESAARGITVLIKKPLASGILGGDSAASLRWVAAQAGVQGVITGTLNDAHLSSNADTLGLTGERTNN